MNPSSRRQRHGGHVRQDDARHSSALVPYEEPESDDYTSRYAPHHHHNANAARPWSTPERMRNDGSYDDDGYIEEVITTTVRRIPRHAGPHVHRHPPSVERDGLLERSHPSAGHPRRSTTARSANRASPERCSYYQRRNGHASRRSAARSSGGAYAKLKSRSATRDGSSRPSTHSRSAASGAERRPESVQHAVHAESQLIPYEDESLEIYETPERRPGGRYGYGQPTPARYSSASRQRHSAVATQQKGCIRVRILRCRSILESDSREVQRALPNTYLALHTAEERGHTGIAERTLDPAFNSEFLFHCADVSRDALVCTLVASSSRARRDRKISECVVSFELLEVGVERAVWVPLVRHPGRDEAYECGEVLLTLFSTEVGRDAPVASAEAYADFAEDVRALLIDHAPKDLHRLDWLVGEYLPLGHAEGLAELRTLLERKKDIEPVRLRATIKSVEGLTDADGAPTQARTCYVELSFTGGAHQTKTVAYHRRAQLEQSFSMVLENPETDAITLSVCSAGRKFGEVLVGLTNLQAGEPKSVSLMLVRAAETGDACCCGRVNLVLCAENYSSPFQMTPQQEEKVRQRVLAYLWTYLRDDLHRVDVITSAIDDVDSYMNEWARVIGPEPSPRELQLRVRQCEQVYPDAATAGAPQRCYVRVSVGPLVYRTSTGDLRDGAVSFANGDTLRVTVYNPRDDPVELMLVREDDTADCEISRTVFGVRSLVRQQTMLRTLPLVIKAQTREASLQGTVAVEMTARNFGDASVAPLSEEQWDYYIRRLEDLLVRTAPDVLHHVPYMLDKNTGAEDEMLSSITREHGAVVATAPMTVHIIGIKEFRPSHGCYVKVYLNNEPILKTRDSSAGASIVFGIEDDNETTVQLSNAQSAELSFKIGYHRPLRRTVVLGRTKVALRGLVRGEKNELWLPFFDSTPAPKAPERNAVVGSDNRMIGATGGVSLSPAAHPARTPLGLLGVTLQSMAFVKTVVTTYKTVDGEEISAMEAVTRDVSSLFSKYKPQDLAKVQPLITECTSLRTAHSELRAKICPKPVGATIYLEVESVEMNSPEGRVQEAAGGVALEVAYEDELQCTTKKQVFENDVIHGREFYPSVRLDITQRGLDGRRITATGGGGGVHDSDAASRKADRKRTNAPLVLTLIGVPGTIRNPSTTAASRPVPQEPPHSPAAEQTSQPRRARSTSLGGKNNINSYLRSSSDDSPRSATNRSPSRPRARSPSTTSRFNTTVRSPRDELGEVQLSLHALLTAPLHKLGDRITVPIINTAAAPSTARGRRSGAGSRPGAGQIVGQVTFRLAMPAFEVLPEWLRLARRDVMSRVDPVYVAYFTRRIGAYLRQHHPAELVSFHYDVFEREVAQGYWPVSLSRWLRALTRRYGPERNNTFGPEPTLAYNLKEQAQLLLTDAATIAPSRETNAEIISERGSEVLEDPSALPGESTRTRGSSRAIAGAEEGNAAPQTHVKDTRGRRARDTRSRATESVASWSF